jgi:uncharacterized protein YecE (DUF72 family)
VTPPRQLGLFDPALDVPPPDPALVALAARVPPHVRFGTSSWTFEGWRGIVYQRKYRNQQSFVQESLAEYARHPLFRTVGIDRSYYAPVPADELRRYAEQLPPGFVCVSKVWSEITTRVFPDHPRHGERAGRPNDAFLDPDLFMREVAGPVLEGLGAHAGPLVLEIPQTTGGVAPAVFAREVDAFLRAVPAGLPLAFELRDRRLLVPEYLDTIARHGATHVFNYWSRMPSIREQLQIDGTMAGPVVVVRLMLPPGERYADLRERYAPFDRIAAPQPEMRDDVARVVDLCARRGQDVFVIVNNKAEGSSPLTIEALARRVAR